MSSSGSRRWFDSARSFFQGSRPRPRRQSVLGVGALQVEHLERRLLLTATSTVGSEFHINTTTSNEQQTVFEAPGSIATDKNGAFVATWASNANTQDTDGFGVFFRRYGSSGSPISGETVANTVKTGDQINPSAAMDALGNFVIVWESDEIGNSDIFAQRYAASGAKRGGVIAVNSPSTADQILPNVSMNDAGEFVVTWSTFINVGSDFDVRAQKFDASGVKVGNEISVNTFTPDSQWFSRVAIDNSGRFVVSWSSRNQEFFGSAHGIFARTFAADPDAITDDIPALSSEIPVNVTFRTLNQTDSYVDILDSGEFIVTWTGFRTGPTESDIFARRFMIDGTAIDAGEFQVNPTGNFDNQNLSTVTYDEYGEFVISWTSPFQDSSLLGVFARRFAANGVAQGGEFQINTFVSNDQTNATVAAEPNGDFVVIWTSLNQTPVPDSDPSTGVFGQRFEITRALALSDSVVTEAGIAITIDLPALVTPAAGRTRDLTSVIIVTPPPGGMVTVDPVTGIATYTPGVGFTGVDTFEYRMLDDEGTSSNKATITVTVTPNVNPIASDISTTTPKTMPIDIDILANVIDPDGGMLDPATVMTMSGPASGTIMTDFTTGVVTYTPNGIFVGTVTFGYTVADAVGNASNVATVTIVVEGVAPTAVPDPRSTPEDTAIAIDILANDTPGDGTIDPATVEIIPLSGPTHGALTLDAVTGVATYMPTAHFFGTDSFRYKVFDVLGQESNEATVTITVTSVPDAPVALDDPVAGAFETNNDTAIDINVLANDSDADGDALTVVMLTAPSNGTAMVDPVTQVVTYTPNPGTSGIDTFTYQASDGGVPLSNIATVTIDVNAPPTANNELANVTPEDVPIDIDVLANDTDVDGSIDPATVTITLAPTKGSTAVNPLTGVVTYTPDLNTNGVDFFRYTVEDNDGATSNEALVLIAVTPVNDPPVAIDEDQVVTPNDVAVDIPVLSNDIDVDSAIDPTTVTITAGPTNGIAVVDPVTGVVTYTPNLGFDGFDEFKYTVRDVGGDVSNEATVPIRVGVNSTVAGEVVIAGSRFPLPGVMVTLTRTDGLDAFTETVATGADGKYLFTDIAAGTYRITETQPAIFSDGPEENGTPAAGTVVNDEFRDVVIALDVDGVGFNFTEAGFRPGFFLTPIGQNLLTAQGASTLSDIVSGALLSGATLADGSYVFTFDAGWEGTRTFEGTFGGGSTVLRMFDNDFNNVATAFPSGNSVTMNWTGTPGAPVFLQVSGTSTDVDLTVTDPNAPIINQPPVLIPIGNRQLNEGGTLSFTAVANDPDAGDVPLYYLGAGAPAGATIDPVTGFFEWTTTDSFASPVEITILAVDSPTPTLWDSETILVTVNNVAPTAAVTGLASGTTNQPYQFTLSATDVSPDDMAAGFTFQIDWNGDGTMDQTVQGLGNLQVQHAFANDGNYQIQVVSVDADGASSAPATHSIVIDGPPAVVEVLVNGTAWSTLSEGIEGTGLGTGGYSIPVGSAEQLRNLPWIDIDQVKIVFNEDVTVNEGDLTISGVNVPVYSFAPGGFSYDSPSRTATWTLANPVNVDTINLVLSESVQDSSGKALDGEWTDSVSTYTSGNGTEGGDFQFKFNVLPGDSNGNNKVDIGDFTFWADRFMATPSTSGAAHADFNVNGVIDIGDFTSWSDHFAMSAPLVSPSAPASGGGGGGSALSSPSAAVDDVLTDWDSSDEVAAPVAAASAISVKPAATVFDIDQPAATVSETEIGWLLLRLLDDDSDEDEGGDI